MPQIAPPPYQSIAGSLQWHAWYRQINDLLERVSVSINAHDDVTITSAADNEFLQWDAGTSKWENETNLVFPGTVDAEGAATFASTVNVEGTSDIEGVMSFGADPIILNSSPALEFRDTNLTDHFIIRVNADVVDFAFDTNNDETYDTEVMTFTATTGAIRTTMDAEALWTFATDPIIGNSSPALEFRDTTASAHNFQVTGNADFMAMNVDTTGDFAYDTEMMELSSSLVRFAQAVDAEGAVTVNSTLDVTGAATFTGDAVRVEGASPTLTFEDTTVDADDFRFSINSNSITLVADQSDAETFGNVIWTSTAAAMRIAPALELDSTLDVEGVATFGADPIIATAVSPRLLIRETGETGSRSQFNNIGGGTGQLSISHDVGNAVMDLFLDVEDGSSIGAIRTHRNTNTTGQVYQQWFRGDGSGTVDHQLWSGSSGPATMAAIDSQGLGITRIGGTLDTEGAATFSATVGVNARIDRNGHAIHGSKTSVTAASYTHLAADRYLLCDTTSNAITVNLIAAATAGDGARLDVKIVNATNAVTIDGSGGETIDGGTTLVLTTLYDNVSLVCDGSNWHIL